MDHNVIFELFVLCVCVHMCVCLTNQWNQEWAIYGWMCSGNPAIVLGDSMNWAFTFRFMIILHSTRAHNCYFPKTYLGKYL